MQQEFKRTHGQMSPKSSRWAGGTAGVCVIARRRFPVISNFGRNGC
ncbi:hypothetical protein X971_2429 [Agrobacterium tumefaciens LBA4213 (Ach5)]|nr:hypothetical protein X971_2429 [Agrobacterium tumefaciens LBA4213 (Ach5)]